MAVAQSRAWILWLVGTLAVVGAILYGFWRYEPDPVDVVGPVEQWSQRWRAARACFVGESPPAATASDAMAIREVWLENPNVALGNCVRPLQQARVPIDETTGSMELDASWHDATTGIRAVREQLRARLAAKKPVPNLGAAIEDVDRAYQRLRQAAGLAPAPLPTGTTAMPRYPEGTVLGLPGDAGPVLPRRVEVSGDTVVVWHHAGERARRLEFRDGELLTDEPVSELLLAANPTWAVVARDVDSSTLGGLEVVAVDDAGAATGDTPIVAAPRPSASATMQARFALGDQQRAVVYRLVEDRTAAGLPADSAGDGDTDDSSIFEPETVQSVVIRASSNAGASWGQAFSVEGGDHGVSVDEVRDRADLWWTSEAIGTSWLRLDSATLPLFAAAAAGASGIAPLEWQTVATLRSKPLAACFSPGAGWWLGRAPAPVRSPDGTAPEMVKGARPAPEPPAERTPDALVLHRLSAARDALPVVRDVAGAPRGEVELLCSDDAVVMRGADGAGLVCGVEDCAAWPASDPLGRERVSMTGVGPVAVFAVSDMVFAREAGDARARPQFRKQLKTEVVGAVRWDGAVHLVLHDVDRVRLVPLASTL